MFPSSPRKLTGRIEDYFRGRIARWLIRRYVKKGKKLTESTLTPTQQIDALQRQIAALRAMQTANPNVSLADQLAAITATPPLVTPALVEQVAATAALPIEPAPPPAPSLESVAAPTPQLEPAPVMEATTPQAAPTAVAVTTPPSTGSTLPDVKMLAPILKIALAVLTIEQMVEIGLHVKMGAPGFQQFLDSDIAKAKFRELYATYCEFLAGKVK